MPQLTAIITGASEGLGKAFAIELGKRGINMVLNSLPDTGLDNLAKYIRKNFEVRVDVIELDLTNTGSHQQIFAY